MAGTSAAAMQDDKATALQVVERTVYIETVIVEDISDNRHFYIKHFAARGYDATAAEKGNDTQGEVCRLVPPQVIAHLLY